LARAGVTWLAVATAPAGFAHVRSTVVGTLLQDIAAGLPIADVARKFRDKMDPRKYQRPTAAPTAGNVRQAEDLVAGLGLAPALRRRYARLEDVRDHAMWLPRASKSVPPGVFGHLLWRVPERREGIGSRLTWSKFVRVVLENADKIDLVVPASGPFHALTTAADPTAPPLLQWDREDARNPVSWYTYPRPTPAAKWGLHANVGTTPVTAIVPMPNMWQAGFERHGAGVVLVLHGCRDSGHQSSAIFPEHVRGDLHSVRSTIEAFSRSTNLEGQAEATACGLAIRAGGVDMQPIRLRVTTGDIVTEYEIDRWD
jgi:hypothetical protein